jgi:hypothetical protein
MAHKPHLPGQHHGPKSKFSVDRSVVKKTFDIVAGKHVEDGDLLTVHWPDIEESLVISVDVSIDSHGTEHSRGYVEVIHFGASVRLYLRDVQDIVSIERPLPKETR